MEKIKVLIADDHAVVRDGTRRILQEEHDIEVVGEAEDGEETVTLAVKLNPDVAIVDIEMPRLNGLEATKQIKAVCPSIAVLILTAYDDDQFVFGLLEAGAAGYLLKTIRSQDLVNAVRAVHSGESVLSPSIARKVMDFFSLSSGKTDKQEQTSSLSQREIEVLKALTRGLSNREIADELCVSMRTVQGHLSTIFSKMQVGSRTEAVIQALKEGVVTLENNGIPDPDL